MKEILAEPEERGDIEAWQMARGKQIIGAWTDPRGSIISVTAGGGGGGGIYQSTTTTQTVTTENQKFGIGWILRKLKTK